MFVKEQKGLIEESKNSDEASSSHALMYLSVYIKLKIFNIYRPWKANDEEMDEIQLQDESKKYFID